jgi:hypothetical protein
MSGGRISHERMVSHRIQRSRLPEVAARSHAVTAYDEGRPTDGTATVSNQPTAVTEGAYVDGYPSDGDTHTTKTGYDWVKGLPTSTTDDPGGLNLVKTTSYDTQPSMEGSVARAYDTPLPRSATREGQPSRRVSTGNSARTPTDSGTGTLWPRLKR